MQTDVIIYENHKTRDGYKYILVLIDVYSRYAAARALRDRTSDTLAEAFADMIKQDFGGVWPRYLNSDREFDRRRTEESGRISPFLALMKQHR